MARVNEKQMIIGFAAVCVLILGLFIYLSYQRYEEIEALKVSNKKKETEIQKEEEKQKEIETFNIEILQLTREYNQYADVLPDDQKLEEFIQAIREITDELGIPPTDFEPKKQKSRGGRRGGTPDLTRVDMPIRFEGTYEQIGQFINKVESYQRLITVNNLQVSSNDSTPPQDATHSSVKDGDKDHILPPEKIILKCSMDLLTYVYNDPVKQEKQGGVGSGPTIGALKKVPEWTPDASRNPFLYVVQLRKIEKEDEPGKVDTVEPEDVEDDICRYYDNDKRCTIKRNGVSDFCQKHFDLYDEISKQENTLAKAKELIQKIEDAFDKGDQRALGSLYGEMDTILRYTFKVEWIKIEIEDVRQRYHKIKEENRKKNYEIILKKALSTKALMLNLFLDSKFMECIAEYKKLTTLLTSDNGSTNDPEFQTILSEARNLKEKAKIHIEFSELPLVIGGIIWIQKHPEESVAIVDGATKSVDDYVNYGARIVEIRKGEVVFSYKGENIARKLQDDF